MRDRQRDNRARSRVLKRKRRAIVLSNEGTRDGASVLSEGLSRREAGKHGYGLQRTDEELYRFGEETLGE